MHGLVAQLLDGEHHFITSTLQSSSEPLRLDSVSLSSMTSSCCNIRSTSARDFPSNAAKSSILTGPTSIALLTLLFDFQKKALLVLPELNLHAFLKAFVLCENFRDSKNELAAWELLDFYHQSTIERLLFSMNFWIFVKLVVYIVFEID